MRQLPYETDGIREQHFFAARQREFSRGRIQGRKELIFREYARIREAVQQGRLARIRIADQGHNIAPALLPLRPRDLAMPL